MDSHTDINFFNTQNTNDCVYLLSDEFNDIINVHYKPLARKGMFSLMHINCRSLLCNYDEILNFNSSLNNVFDVLCVSETWLTDATEDLINIEGYTFVGKHRKNQRGGGVGIYVRNELKFKIRRDIISDSENCEIIAIEIVNDKEKNIIIITDAI